MYLCDLDDLRPLTSLWILSHNCLSTKLFSLQALLAQTEMRILQQGHWSEVSSTCFLKQAQHKQWRQGKVTGSIKILQQIGHFTSSRDKGPGRSANYNKQDKHHLSIQPIKTLTYDLKGGVTYLNFFTVPGISTVTATFPASSHNCPFS